MKQTRPCEICKKPLHPERARYYPRTRLCIRHARQIERYGGEFFRLVYLSRLSKQQSLKKNYGDVNVEFVRNAKGVEQLHRDYELELSST